MKLILITALLAVNSITFASELKEVAHCEAFGWGDKIVRVYVDSSSLKSGHSDQAIVLISKPNGRDTLQTHTVTFKKHREDLYSVRSEEMSIINMSSDTRYTPILSIEERSTVLDCEFDFTP